MKNISGKTTPTAAVDCVSSCPTKNVSAMTYKLVTSIPTMVGTAIVGITQRMGAVVR